MARCKTCGKTIFPESLDANWTMGELPMIGRDGGKNYCECEIPRSASDIFMLPDYPPEALERVYQEGLRVGKVPWVCDGRAQTFLASRLSGRGITGRETMQETAERRKAESGVA